jgi:hypothetical protein
MADFRDGSIVTESDLLGDVGVTPGSDGAKALTGASHGLLRLDFWCGKRRIEHAKHSVNFQGATDACSTNKVVDDPFVLDHDESE